MNTLKISASITAVICIVFVICGALLAVVILGKPHGCRYRYNDTGQLIQWGCGGQTQKLDAMLRALNTERLARKKIEVSLSKSKDRIKSLQQLLVAAETRAIRYQQTAHKSDLEAREQNSLFGVALGEKKVLEIALAQKRREVGTLKKQVRSANRTIDRNVRTIASLEMQLGKKRRKVDKKGLVAVAGPVTTGDMICRVVGIRRGDVLPVRKLAKLRTKILAKIPHNASNIRAGDVVYQRYCRSHGIFNSCLEWSDIGWRAVQYRNKIGWSADNYLTCTAR